MPRWRDLVPPLVLLLLLGVAGGAAWLTRHPESPVLDRAAGWPLVGPAVDRFRAAYRPPAAAVDGRDPPGAEASGDEWATTAAEAPAVDLPRAWVAEGTVVRRAPRPDAAAAGEVPVIANLPVLERRGDWIRVYHRGLEGWASVPAAADGEPPLGREPDPVVPLAPRPPAPAALAAARARLTGEVAVAPSHLGPYVLYTDVDDAAFLAPLDRLAASLDATYEARYGLRPRGTPRAAVVLYRDETSYRLLQAASAQIAGLTASGHSAPGLALLFRGGRSDDAVAGTLVHELVHLVNRRAIGPALPSWIDEGLADDLALSAAAPDGTLDPSRLSGTSRRDDDDRVVFTGGEAVVFALRDGLRDRTLPPVPELLALDWEGFVRSENSRLHYASAALFVRWLLEAEGGRRAGALRAFLADVAAGGPASPDALRALLGQPWPVIDALFRHWIGGRAEELVAAHRGRRYRLVIADEDGQP